MIKIGINHMEQLRLRLWIMTDQSILSLVWYVNLIWRRSIVKF